MRRTKKIIILIDTGEELYSEGMYAAIPSLQQAQWALTTEIIVKSKLDDPPTIIYGRPGRLTFDATIHGLKSCHLGAIEDPSDPDFLPNRVANTMLSIPHTQIPIHENHRHMTDLPPSYCYVKANHTRDVTDLTTTTEEALKIEAFYTNANLTPPLIEMLIRRQIADTLGGEDGIAINSCPRPTRPIKPWLEDPNHPLVQAALGELNNLTHNHARMAVARPTANEGIIAHELGIPVVTLPPQMQGEHSKTECCKLSYIDNVMVPWLRAMVASRHSFTQWC